MKAKPLVLVVDDQPINIDLLEAYLVPQGYEILRAEDGEAAMRAIGEHPVDLVLLDVMMPILDGFEVCRRIKGDERLRDIPVVLITALAAKEDRIRGIEAGAEDFISKPIDRGEVLARVRMLLNMKTLNGRLKDAYEAIGTLTDFGEASIRSFDPLDFLFLAKVDDIVRQTIRNAADAFDKPKLVVVGLPDERRSWQWYRYEYAFDALRRSLVGVDVQLGAAGTGKPRIVFFNKKDYDLPECRSLVKAMGSLSIAATNMVCYLSDSLCILAVNYGREVTRYDASVLNSFVMQSLFLK
jgi:CheY-like chemotaxis protein